MNTLIFIVSAIAWYAGCEWLLGRLRRTNNTPRAAPFWLGILQSVGTFILVVAAAVEYILSRS